MTTAKTPNPQSRFRLPDPPPREPDEITAFDHIYKHGNNHYLAIHFGNPDTTLVEYDRWVILSPQANRSRARRPDLLIAFDVDPTAYEASNGYVISEQGKPPDFVLEVASESTSAIDTGAKRDDYAALGIPEYWRFDETGEHHGARLAGDRLVEGRYEPISIAELPDGGLQGYSIVLNLNLRWVNGQLFWIDPATGQPILTYEDQLQRAESERNRVDSVETELRSEREARMAAEARIRELERVDK